MSQATRPLPVRQASPEWIMRPLWRRPTDETLPGGKTGLLKLTDGQVYLVEPINNATVGQGVTLCKSNGELYFVNLSQDVNKGIGTCNCAAFTYRKSNLPCKHLTQVREALLQLLPDVADVDDPFADETDEGACWDGPARAFGFDEPTPPAGPAALPMPARKPNHRFAAEVA
jgi:hypothetical protein